MVEETDIIKRIKKNRTREKEVLQALQKKDGSAWEEDEVAYMEGRIYVPNNKDIKQEILKEHHDPADVRHPGQHRMIELIKRTYWWPGLKEDVKKICSRMCQVSTEQGATSKKGRQTSSSGDSRRTMVGHQYRHDRSIAKIK